VSPNQKCFVSSYSALSAIRLHAEATGPGTVLVRDYQGQRHTVIVAADGFNWQGTTYPSLSAIARAITGTAWSGPRFFAVARGSPNKTWVRAA
jgi:hypothetical protein